MTGYGPPDDPSDAPTGSYDYGDAGDPPSPQGGGPWYQSPIIMVALGLFVAIPLGLALYVFADTTAGQGGTTQTPTSPTTSTTTPTTSAGTTTTTTTTTEPVAPPVTTTTTEPTTTALAPTTSADEEHHHHHHDWMPWP